MRKRRPDGTDHFTIHDFVRPCKHFSDPEWDGESLEPEACPAQLCEIGQMIDADESDLYDVLAYIAFSLAPVTRAEREVGMLYRKS